MLGVAIGLVGRLKNSVSPYAVLGYSPGLVLDFTNEYYRTGGALTTFDSALTATRAGNATMVDSDGKIKWAPHNLLKYSEQFDNAIWGLQNIAATTAIAPDGKETAYDISLTSTTNTYHLIVQGVTGAATGVYTFAAFFKANEENYAFLAIKGNNAAQRYVAAFNLTGSGSVSATLTSGSPTGTNATISSLGGGWYYCAVSISHTSGSVDIAFGPNNNGTLSDINGSYAGVVGNGIYAWGAHLYRSDLGGMVDNPDRGDSYVPTTSAARYLPRRGHHVYNGSEWVNEGLLVESEARTNLFLNSGSLSTQSVTVTAVPHTLSFTGTGTITLTGVSTAGPLIGTGTGENNRVSLTFTPTAGVLLATVTGTVTNAQLEAGSTPSSYIPTAGATVTRAAETLVIPSANLPWPAPVVVGPELVTNGTFDTDTTGWTAFLSTISWVSGKIRVQASTTGISARVADQLMTGLTVGKVYRLVGSVVAQNNFGASNGNASLYIRNTANTLTIAASLLPYNTLGDISLSFVATETSQIVRLRWDGDVATTDASFDFDNISVKEINPLSVSIAMDGRMTYADTESSGEVRPFRWYTDSNNNFQMFLQTNYGTGRMAFTQKVGGIEDAVVSGGSQYAPGVLTPFSTASRHGSTFINGAVDGVALTADLTPVALPDLSATNLQLGYTFMGTIGSFRIWADDIGNAGLVTATNPSTEPSLLLTFDSAETSFVDLGWSE